MNGYGWCFAWASSFVLGCGGISEPGARGGDGAGSGGRGGSTSTNAPGVRAELAWTAPLANYGLYERALLSVDPGEARVLVPPDGTRGGGPVELSLLDGSRLTHEETPLLARSAAWTRDLRATSDAYRGVDVFDRSSRERLLVLRGPLGGAGMSADGRYLATLDCDGRALVRNEVDTGGAVAVSLAHLPSGCPSSQDLQVAPVVVVPGGDVALLAWSVRGALVRVDFRNRTATLHGGVVPDSEPGPYPLRGEVLSIEPSPSGRRVAVTAAREPIRLYDLEDLDTPVLELESSWLAAFERCYCITWTFSPLAWSPDERTLALLDDAGGAVLRRAADGALVGELSGAGGGDGAAAAHLLAFTPSGRGLVSVVYEQTRGGRVAHYRLTE